MKYKKEKVEAVKVLFAEVLEVNERLEENRANKEIQFEINGGTFPNIFVHFWDWNCASNPVEVFEIALDGFHHRAGRRHDLKALSEKVEDWGKKFGTPPKENG